MGREIWFNTKVIADILEITPVTVSRMCGRGQFPNARRGHDGHWQIPLSDVDAYHHRFEDTVSAGEAAELLGYGTRQIVAKHCRQGDLPGAFLEGNQWYIPLDAIEAYERPERSRGPTERDGACPRCGIITGGELCSDCRREKAGNGCRWYETPTLSSNWAHQGGVRL